MSCMETPVPILSLRTPYHVAFGELNLEE
jgi:hypothetical protein